MPPADRTTRALSFRELLDYTAEETRRWHSWFGRQPAAVLDTSLGEGRIATIRDLLQHIFAVEQRYGERLLGRPVSGYAVVDATSVTTLFIGGETARALLEEYLADAAPADLARRLEFQTLSAGTQSATARKIVSHTLMHGIRHWAQLAMALRQRGYATDWPHDLLFSEALP